MKTDSEFLSPLLVQEQFLNTFLSYIFEFYSPSLLHTIAQIRGLCCFLSIEQGLQNQPGLWVIVFSLLNLSSPSPNFLFCLIEEAGQCSTKLHCLLKRGQIKGRERPLSEGFCRAFVLCRNQWLFCMDFFFSVALKGLFPDQWHKHHLGIGNNPSSHPHLLAQNPASYVIRLPGDSKACSNLRATGIGLELSLDAEACED